MSKSAHSHRHSPGPVRRRAFVSKRAAIIGAVLVVALIVAAVLIFSPKSNSLPSEISADLAYQQYQQGAFFLDVRSVDEWNAFHVPGSTLIPLDQLAARVDEVPRNQPVVVVCRTGSRSRSGRDILLNAGFTQVTSVTGGLTAWSKAGYPVDGTRP
jgi:rhodanese-related sulfurtransferase